MAFRLAELFVTISGNDKALSATLAGIQSSLLGLGGLGARAGHSLVSGVAGSLAGLGVMATTALAGGVVAGGALAAAGLYKAVGAASDLSETLAKTGEVFGTDTGQVTAFADKMAADFGIVKTEVLDAASMFGLIAQGAGIAQKESAGLSTELAGLAADASSFYNVPVAAALEKIRAGLTGESEPLRAFGVMLSEDAVKAKALAMGFTEVNDRVKTLARAELIKEGLGKATGDLERTKAGFANTTRAISGQFQNMMADIGLAVMPAAQSVTAALGKAFGGIGAWVSSNKGVLAGWANAAAAAFGKVLGFVGSLGPVVSAVFGRIGSVLGSLAPSFAALGGVARRVFSGLGTALGSAVAVMAPAFATMRGLFSATVGAVSGIVRGLGPTFLAVAGGIMGVYAAIQRQFSAVMTSLMTRTGELAEAIGEFLGSKSVASIRDGLGGAFTWLSNQVMSVVGPVFDWLKGVVTGAIDAIIFTFRNWDDIAQLVGIQLQSTLTHTGEMFTWLMGAASTLLGWFESNWKDVLKNAFDAGYAVVRNSLTNLKDLVQATWDFMMDPAGGFHFKGTGLLDGFKSTLKELPKIVGPQLTNFEGQINEVLDRIGASELARANRKVKEALKPPAATGAAEVADAGGGAGGAAKPPTAAAAREKKEPKVQTLGLQEFARSLQESVFKKDDDTKRLVQQGDTQVQLAREQNQKLDRLAAAVKGGGVGLVGV